MKQPKKPTRTQKEFMSKKKLVATNWMVVSDDTEKMVVINKITGKEKELKK